MMNGDKSRWVMRFKQFFVITKFELLRHLRRRRVYFMAAILALIMFLPQIITTALNLGIPDDPKDFITQQLSMIDMLIILSATFFAGDVLVSEYEKRTGYTLFPNPLRKEVIYMGKMASSLLASLMVILIYYIYGAATTYVYYSTIPGEIWTSLGYAILYTFAVVGLAFLFNVLNRSTMTSTLLTFFTLFMILPIVTNVISLTGSEPWYILTYAADVITLVFNPPKVRKVEIKVRGMTLYQFYPDFYASTLVILAYAVVTIFASLIMFKKRELKE
ncbi:MAG: ABC transporter permease [Candidatus Njordarchaeia archaeon]